MHDFSYFLPPVSFLLFFGPRPMSRKLFERAWRFGRNEGFEGREGERDGNVSYI